MKRAVPFFYLIVMLLPCSLFAQNTDSSDFNMDDFPIGDWWEPNPPPEFYSINQLPISIFFLKSPNDSLNTGFVVAGHAFKEVCQVASLKIKNFLDSVGYRDNTIFSFGVGFDLCESRDSLHYSDGLERLKTSLQEQQQLHPDEIFIAEISDTLFKNTGNKLRENGTAAFNELQQSDSVSRIILRYDNKNFPIPSPFYTKDSIIRFTISKSSFGNIPGTQVFDVTIIDKAIAELSTMISVNSLAMQQFNKVNLSNYLRFTRKTPIQYYQGDKLVRDSIGFSSVTTGNSPFPTSLEALSRQCDAHEPANIDAYQYGKKVKVTACEALRIIHSSVENQEVYSKQAAYFINIENEVLKEEKASLIKMKAAYRSTPSSDERPIIIDAFLRGWCFRAPNHAQQKQLSEWYKSRKKVWEKILAKNTDYRNRLKLKNTTSVSPDIIAGIFHYDDVFFQVRDAGTSYVITPYKMLNGSFIQVIEKNNSVEQFLSQNNFRLIKL